MSIIDCHAHLEAIDDLGIVLMRAKSAGVTTVVTCGSSIEWSRKCVKIADENSGNLVKIFACCGIHPQDGREEVKKLGSKYIDDLKKLATSSKKVVAIGECGLDFKVASNQGPGTSEEERKFQTELFEEQIKLALELNKPIVVHCRNAWKETMDIISKYKLNGMFHSFTGSLKDAKRAINLGFYISFSGIVTFQNAGEIVDAAKWVSLDRMLLETDSPFLSPEPVRSKKNTPENVRITGEFIASLRSISPEKLFEATSRNAEELFGLKLE